MVYVPPLKSRHRRLDMPRLRAEQQAFLDGLRVACLEHADAALPNATPDEVVRDARARYDALSGFLLDNENAADKINGAARRIVEYFLHEQHPECIGTLGHCYRHYLLCNPDMTDAAEAIWKRVEEIFPEIVAREPKRSAS